MLRSEVDRSTIESAYTWPPSPAKYGASTRMFPQPLEHIVLELELPAQLLRDRAVLLRGNLETVESRLERATFRDLLCCSSVFSETDQLHQFVMIDLPIVVC